jgi:hypothetical protein
MLPDLPALMAAKDSGKASAEQAGMCPSIAKLGHRIGGGCFRHPVTRATELTSC